MKLRTARTARTATTVRTAGKATTVTARTATDRSPIRFTRRSPTALALSCVIVLSCSLRKNGLCESSTEAVTAPLQKIIDSDNAKDLNAVLSHYTEDVTWLPPAGNPLQGKSAIRARYETLFSTFKIDLKCEIFEVGPSGDMAFVRGSTSGTLTPLTGGEPTVVDDKFLAIVKCTSGTWLVSHLMWSPRRQPL